MAVKEIEHHYERSRRNLGLALIDNLIICFKKIKKKKMGITQSKFHTPKISFCASHSIEKFVHLIIIITLLLFILITLITPKIHML